MEMTNKMMEKYVEFICSLINKNQNVYIKHLRMTNFTPVEIEVKETLTRSALLKIKFFGYEKEFIFYMSRRKGPEELLDKLQSQINDIVNDIISENKIDTNQIYKKYNLLYNTKLP